MSLICAPIPKLSLSSVRGRVPNGFGLLNSVLLMIGHVFAYWEGSLVGVVSIDGGVKHREIESEPATLRDYVRSS